MFNKTDKYIALAAVCMLTFSACSSDDALSSADKEGGGKTPIELTVGIAGASPSVTTRGVTRTVVTADATNAKAFSAGTSLYMVIKSEDANNANATYTRTIGYAQEAATTPSNATSVKFASSYTRYWEDGQTTNTRDSKLSIYSACVPGYRLSGTESLSANVTATGTVDATTWTVGGSTDYLNTWGSGLSSTTIVWPLRGVTSSATQDATFITNQDLCFSNNVSNLSSDDRLKFTQDATTKKWSTNSGNMVFYHALTWITFRIQRGEGFGTTSSDFQFTESGKNIVLKGFNTSGTFDIAQGEFLASSTIGTNDITFMAQANNQTINSVEYQYVLDALMLPGTYLNSATVGDISFTIDHNEYRMSKKQLMDAMKNKKLSDNTNALDGDGQNIMRPGVHYIFDLTVGKQKVDKITATLADWEEVNASETPTNARITVSCLEYDPNTDKSRRLDKSNYDLYRTQHYNSNTSISDDVSDYDYWKTGYLPNNNPNTDRATLEATSTDKVYAAYSSVKDANNNDIPWYWPNNRTFYHFRTVMPKNHTVTKDETNGDYISLEAKEYIDNDANSYKDVCWGAPFDIIDYTNSERLTYNTSTGFDVTNSSNTSHQISKAIGPTNGTIILQMFHMMSDVTIKLTTPTTSEKVNLAGATISISNTYSDGKVRMGNGLVVPGTLCVSNPSKTISTPYTSSEFSWRYGFIPQELSSVVLTIIAEDNKYEVNMWEVIFDSFASKLIDNPYNKNTDDKYIIDRWYPNFKYTYTFNLTKSGIASITATLADWETVEASQNVQIK